MPDRSSTSVKPFTATSANGEMLSYASSTYFDYTVETSVECAGASSVISTVTSITSAYSVSTASVASIASASAASASWASDAAKPSAECAIIDDDGFGDMAFRVDGISGWAGDGGDSLAQQEGGCGIMSGWEWHPGQQSTFESKQRDTQTAFFGMSFMKAGCIESAIHSAGGPDGLQCQSGGDGDVAVDAVTSNNSSSSTDAQDNDQAAHRIVNAQLISVQAVANGTWTNGTVSNVASNGQAAQPDPSLQASASAALPHLSAAASSRNSATPTPIAS
jgi:hypothetical protein